MPSLRGISYGPANVDPTCPQPPDQSVRDHATFSAAELKLYGLPDSSTFKDKAEWARNVRAARVRSCATSGIYVDGLPARNTLSSYSDITHAGGGSFTGWGADEIIHPQTATEGYYHVPGLHDPGHITDGMSAWLGIGNDGPNAICQPSTQSASLLQAGTSTYTYLGNVYYQAWMENLGEVSSWCGAQAFQYNCSSFCIPWPVTAGDLIYQVLGCQCAGNNVYFNDQTLGLYYSGPGVRTGSPAPYEGSTIGTVEDNAGNGTLANFGTVSFQYVRSEIKNSNGTYTEYSITHVPSATIVRQTQVSTANNSIWCAHAALPNNPTDPTWPDSSFDVTYYGANVSGC